MARKRKAGEGTLRLRTDGRWEGRVVVGYDDHGKPRTKSVTAHSKGECLEKLDQLKAACGIVTGKAKPDMPFGEWLDLWYKTYSKPTLRVTTQQSYENRIYLHIIPHIGKIPLNKLQQSDLQQFYAALKKSGRLIRTDHFGHGLSDRMVRSCHATCRTALEHGMDVKTLSAIIGHISSATTIDIYSHITDSMQLQAANKIEQGIGRNEAFEPHETIYDQTPAEQTKLPQRTKFEPYRGKIRKSGTGGIYEINDHLFEGRYTPTNARGKREVHTVYAKTKEECEVLLEQMITEVRARIKAEKERIKQGADSSESAPM